MISLVFPFAPSAWQRVKRGAMGNAYVPEKTEWHKADLATYARQYCRTPLEGALKITVLFFVKGPKKRKHARPITRPDLDNYLKSVMDGLNGVVWKDDSQIVTTLMEKHYANESIGPRITLKIEQVTE